MKAPAARLVWRVILVGFAASVRAQDADEAGVRTKILALEHAWNQAEAFNELKALESILDNRLIYIDSDGTLMTECWSTGGLRRRCAGTTLRWTRCSTTHS